MDLKKFEKITSFFNKLIENNFNKFLLSINELNIIRSHFNYINIINNKKNFNFRKFLRYFSISKKKKYLNKDIVIISSYISQDRTGRNDFYFSHILKEIKKEKYFIIYKNFTNNPPLIDDDSLEILDDNRNIFFETYNFFRIAIILIKLNFKFYRIIKDENLNIKINSFKVYKGALYNLNIVRKILLILKKTNPKKIILTLEGYSWEKLLIYEIKKLNLDIEIFGYYFSIISKYQNYPLKFDISQFNPNYILTSGDVSKNKIIEMGFDKEKTYNIGSNKVYHKNNNNHKKSNSILLLPEAFENEVNYIFNFAYSCSKKYEMNFILRLHPAFKMEANFKKKINALLLDSNIFLSQNSLEEDLSKSKIAIYRGSGSIIEAVLHDVYPVYLSKKNELTIDPLYQLDDQKVNVSNIEEFYQFKKTFYQSDKVKKFYKIKNYCMNYYNNSNSELIKKLFLNI